MVAAARFTTIATIPKRLSLEHIRGSESLGGEAEPSPPYGTNARENLPLDLSTHIVTGMEPPRPPAYTRPPGR